MVSQNTDVHYKNKHNLNTTLNIPVKSQSSNAKLTTLLFISTQNTQNKRSMLKTPPQPARTYVRTYEPLMSCPSHCCAWKCMHASRCYSSPSRHPPHPLPTPTHPQQPFVTHRTFNGASRSVQRNACLGTWKPDVLQSRNCFACEDLRLRYTGITLG